MSMLPMILVALQATPIEFEDLTALESRIVVMAGAAIGEPGGPIHRIDRRLRLRRCPVAAVIAPSSGGLGAACPMLGWRVYVALDRNVHAESAGEQTAAPVIRRGDAVLVRITGRGFAAGLRAVALEDGAVGARIRLRPNASPSSPIMAVVTGPGEATPTT